MTTATLKETLKDQATKLKDVAETLEGAMEDVPKKYRFYGALANEVEAIRHLAGSLARHAEDVPDA